ncbi:MAG: hypothetical protein JRM80_11910 [Nitrososphaerota archaeon]|nr:hypothetical protein [Nitrososphaerota archaeon]
MKISEPRLVLLVSIALIPILAFPAASIPAVALSSPATIVSADHGSAQSTNWSGYAVTGTSGSVSAASDSWVVPSVTCPSSGTYYSSFWVGIDGYTSSTVEQTGTDSDCHNGVASYYAWYEFFPSPSHTISAITVHPGDVMAAVVFYSAGTFKAQIKDETTGAQFGASATVSGAARSSAEWIVEAPSTCLLKCHLTSLADFGTAKFGLDNTGISMTCELIMNGATGSIGSFGSNVQEITMVSQTNPSQVKAQPSALATDGQSFTIQWISSGP